MLRFLSKLTRKCQTAITARAPRRAPQRRPCLGVEALEWRLLLSTTPYFQFLLVPTSAQAGSSFKVEVQERGNLTTDTATAPTPTSATMYMGAYGATAPVATISLLDGIGYATVQVPTTPETVYLEAAAGSIRGYANFVATPGPLTLFAINAPSQATAGTPFRVTVTAEDAFGNTVTSDTQAPTLTASAAASVSGFSWSNGVGTATVSQSTVGSLILTAAAGSVGNSVAINVIPALATHFDIFVNSSVVSGNSFDVYIEAHDAFGNLVGYFNQTPTITAGYGFPVSVSSVSWYDGTADAVVTLTSPGTTTLTATVGSVTGTSQNIAVVPNTSSNWSGYAASGLSNVTAVGGTWVQPAVTGPSGALGAIWVGIDGSGSPTVEQCGTNAYVGANGQVQYSAWYEFFGDQTPSSQNPNPNPKGPNFYQVTIPNFTVQPGDTISASVALVPTTTGTFTFEMTDKPANGGPAENFYLTQTMQYVTPQRSSAEWIVERPGHADGSLYTLPNFGQVTFTGAWAEAGATTSHAPTIGSLYSLKGAQALDMTTNAGNVLSATGAAADPNTLGYNEPAAGVSSAVFTVSWEPGTSPPLSYVPGPGTGGGNGVGSTASNLGLHAPTAGVTSSSLTVAAPSTNGVAAPAANALNPATGSSGNRGSTAVVDAVFAQDAPDNHLHSAAAVDALFALDGLGNHHRNELLW